MAERIQARVGDTVETSFNLVYKKAEVARLPDHQDYGAIDFMMSCEVGGKEHSGAGIRAHPGERIICAVREVAQDDQRVETQWFFQNDEAAGPTFFQVGDLWKLYLGYVRKGAAFTEGPGSPRVHLLAEVELVANAPPPPRQP